MLRLGISRLLASAAAIFLYLFGSSIASELTTYAYDGQCNGLKHRVALIHEREINKASITRFWVACPDQYEPYGHNWDFSDVRLAVDADGTFQPSGHAGDRTAISGRIMLGEKKATVAFKGGARVLRCRRTELIQTCSSFVLKKTKTASNVFGPERIDVPKLEGAQKLFRRKVDLGRSAEGNETCATYYKKPNGYYFATLEIIGRQFEKNKLYGWAVDTNKDFLSFEAFLISQDPSATVFDIVNQNNVADVDWVIEYYNIN